MTRVLRLACLLAMAAPPAAAQGWDAARPVRVVVGYSAGGGAFDAVARAIADGLHERLGNPVVVDNRPGAGGAIGSDHVAKAAPDGHTLLIGGAGTHGVTPAVRRNLPFDAGRDFTAVARIAEFTNVMVVPAELQPRTVREFVDWARARPGGIVFGSQGTGTSIHLTGEIFRLRTGLDMTHVPYRGSGQVVTDMRAGRVQVMFDNLPSVLGQVQGGALRALAVTAGQRVAPLPEVPTMAEAGIPGFVVTSWVGVFGPARLPPAAVERLSAAILATVAAEPAAGRLRNLGAELAPAGPAAFDAAWRADMRRWAEVVAAAGVQPED